MYMATHIIVRHAGNHACIVCVQVCTTMTNRGSIIMYGLLIMNSNSRWVHMRPTSMEHATYTTRGCLCPTRLPGQTSQHVHWSSHGVPPVVPVESTSVPTSYRAIPRAGGPVQSTVSVRQCRPRFGASPCSGACFAAHLRRKSERRRRLVPNLV